MGCSDISGLVFLDMTVLFREYICKVRGANTRQRVPWSWALTYEEARLFLSQSFINGAMSGSGLAIPRSELLDFFDAEQWNRLLILRVLHTLFSLLQCEQKSTMHHIAAKRLLQRQQDPGPQAGMVLNQRPNERMVSSSSWCS
ncbi:unnamed protein product [Urochloa humidicola]